MLTVPLQYLRTLRILHLALCGGVVLFSAVILFQRQAGIMDPVLQDQEPLLLPIAGVFLMVCIAASVLIFKRKLNDVRAMTGLERKLPAYRSAQVIRWALADAPALFTAVLMLLTTSPLFIAFAAAALVYLIGSRPPFTIEQACDTMNISWEERSRWEAMSGPGL